MSSETTTLKNLFYDEDEKNNVGCLPGCSDANFSRSRCRYINTNEPQQKENTQKKEIPNPEKTARRRTDEMDKVLNLTEKQYKKIYKLNLKEEREKLEVLIGRGGKDMNRPPMREGGCPR